jgi:serine/threonine-protein kinase
VTVIVSSGLGSGALPNVVSLPQAAAVRRLQAGGFKPTVQTQASATVSSGTVISTDPTAGTELQGGSPVTVVVSSGPPRAVVPGLTGKTQAEASAALAAAGLKVGSISYRSANGQAPGTVLSQTPAAGEQALSGGEVALVLAQASSEAAVPGVVGEGETQAAAALARAGFNPRSVSRETGDAKKVGVVLAQRPSAGSRARRGTTVTIAVGTLRQTTTTTSTTTTPTTSTTTTAPSTTTTTPAPPSPSKP